MNIWRRQPIDRNPYVRNAFRVARVGRDVVRLPVLVQRINQTRQIAAAGKHTIAGNPVSLEEVNEAAQILSAAPRRIAEELLEHEPERMPLERLRKLAQEAAEHLDCGTSEPPAIVNCADLQPLAQAVVKEFLRAMPGSDPSFGALELLIPPPFGWADNEN
jgi:hypothetical protein